jgi:hypothetical protein
MLEVHKGSVVPEMALNVLASHQTAVPEHKESQQPEGLRLKANHNAGLISEFGTLEIQFE